MVSHHSCDKMAKSVLQGDRRSLSQAITLIESDNEEHQEKAQILLEILQNHLNESKHFALRLGLSGAPGVGKSTFTEALGLKLIENGHKLAVLAIDPSSVGGGGAILADKTRMPQLAAQSNAYIRPSPSRTTLGGVARRTREAVLLCEAAGFDRIIIETVGVGQSEVSVADMCDLFLLLLLPKSGDEFQALKRGIMQMADIIIVNKTDGDSRSQALRTAAEYRAALRLMMPRIEGWQVPVLNISALHDEGLEEVLAILQEGLTHIQENNLWQDYRRQQNLNWMWSDIRQLILEYIGKSDKFHKIIAEKQKRVAEGSLLPTRAAADIFKKLGLK